MAGIKLTDLPIDNSINSTDAFLKVKDGTSYQVSGSTLINQFSGLGSASNLGSGSAILNISETTKTTLRFNSLSGIIPIQVSSDPSSKTVNVGIADNSILGTKIANNAITSSKLASNAVNTLNVIDGAITPNKQSGVRYSRSTKTNTQLVAANSVVVISGLSVTVTPITENSVILVGGYISIGGVNGYINLLKTVNGTTTTLSIGDNTNIGNRSRSTLPVPRAGDIRTATVIPINFYDVAGTTSSITYSVSVGETGNSTMYVNAAYDDLNNISNTRCTSQITAIVFP